MPKEMIDYSNTIIYKIFCKDYHIRDTYIGYTTNFTKRKYFHKSAVNKMHINLPIYETIRDNGGWENWHMIELDNYSCKDKKEVLLKQQEHYMLETDKMRQMLKNANKTNQLLGHFHNSDEPNHICSSKIKPLQNKFSTNQENANKMLINANEKYVCDVCSKNFTHQSSYCRHKKSCFYQEDEEEHEEEQEEKENELIMLLIKQNSLLMEQNATLVQNGITNIHTSHTNSHNNSHNKTFNLQVFLNETCKDAMNIMDFVDSIKLQLSDLEKVGELGYVEGISSIIIKNLNALDITQRPVHCTDKKRETTYIKDQDKWEKEDINKMNLHKMVRKIANKNISLIKEYKERYPDCIKSASKYSNKYNKIVIESMGCSGETNEFEKEERIIKNIVKNVIINKDL